jgi:excisionase family DNA binding protein
MPNDYPEADDLLRPREVAQLFGVRTATIARWAREGKLTPIRTPGGHRRYSRADIRRLLADETTPNDAQQLAEDAARLYDQGWSIRQVAEKFDYSYGAMRRMLGKHIALRNRGGTYAGVYPEDRT